MEFFSDWTAVARVVVFAVLGYAGLVVILRTSGKRTLAKMNIFDLVVTVAFGSALASVIVTKTVSLVEGLVAFAMLAGLQFAVNWLSYRWRPLRRAIKAEPRLLLYRGGFLDDAMRKERVTESEVRQAIRQHGHAAVDEVAWVVLETDGTLSVGKDEPPGERSALADLPHDRTR